MKTDAMHWPGAVEMFLRDKRQRMYRTHTFTAGGPLGGGFHWAKTEADAIAESWRIINNAIAGGRCAVGYIVNVTATELSDGQAAAHITGSED